MKRFDNLDSSYIDELYVNHQLTLPQITTQSKQYLTPSSGTIIFNTDTDSFEMYKDGEWIKVSDGQVMDNYYTRSETDTSISQLNTSISLKADKVDTYTKASVDTLLSNKLNTTGGTLSGTLYAPAIDANGTLSLGENVTTLNLACSTNLQTVNIGGNSGQTVINIGSVGDTINIGGTLTTVNTENTTIKDKCIVLNKDGATSTAGLSGVEFEENGISTGYIKMASSRDKYTFKPSGSSYVIETPTLSQNEVIATKTAVDLKANTSDVYDKSITYTKTEIDNKDTALQSQITANSNSITTLSSVKANLSDVYIKTLLDASYNNIISTMDASYNSLTTNIGTKANSSDVYNKTWFDASYNTISNSAQLSKNRLDYIDSTTLPDIDSRILSNTNNITTVINSYVNRNGDFIPGSLAIRGSNKYLEVADVSAPNPNTSGSSYYTGEIRLGNDGYFAKIRSYIPNGWYVDREHLGFYTTTQANTSNVTERLTITAFDGYIGINNTSPSTYLDVSGSTIIRGNLGIGTTNISNALTISKYYQNGGTHTEATDSKILLKANDAYGVGIQLRVPANSTINESDLQLTTSNNDGNQVARITIKGTSNSNGGNVGIGTTDPNHKLDVAGIINSSGGELGLYRNLTDNANRRNWSFKNEVYAAGDFGLYMSSTNTGTPNNSVLYVNYNGQVNINVYNPSQYLACNKHVYNYDANANGYIYGQQWLYPYDNRYKMIVDSHGSWYRLARQYPNNPIDANSTISTQDMFFVDDSGFNLKKGIYMYNGVSTGRTVALACIIWNGYGWYINTDFKNWGISSITSNSATNFYVVLDKAYNVPFPVPFTTANTGANFPSSRISGFYGGGYTGNYYNVVLSNTPFQWDAIFFEARL